MSGAVQAGSFLVFYQSKSSFSLVGDGILDRERFASRTVIHYLTDNFPGPLSYPTTSSSIGLEGGPSKMFPFGISEHFP